MDVGGISSYTNYLQSQNTSASKLKESVDGKDYSQASDEELLDVCKQFESYFLEQIFKEMQKTVDCFKDEDGVNPNNNLVTYFRDEVIQDLAETSTEKQGLGLAQMMYEQMKQNYSL
ncbi:hypothetical protein IMSAGC019_03296 [Lachnospiraceae bacterium]|nr:hypothetical protein IMSAGC019_03296 [Lachnospiraceae bacterium]